VTAADEADAAAQVERARGTYLVALRRLPKSRLPSFAPKVRPRLLMVGLDSLEFMLATGVKINAALHLLAQSAPPGAARRLWSGIARHVEATGSVSGGFAAFPTVFGDAVVGIVAAHENAGRLPEGIRLVRAHVVRMEEIRRESVRSLAYPAVVGATGLAAAAVLAIFTLPRFARMLREVGVTHPNPITQGFLVMSDFATHRPLGVLALAAAPAVLAAAACNRHMRPAWDRVVLKLPVVSKAAEALALARICATYRALSGAGIRVIESLEFCGRAAGNSVYERGIGRVIDSLRANETVGRSFESAGVFAPELVLAVSGAEGHLTEVFGRMADHYADEARHQVALALRLLEPALILLVLLWVAGVALAVVLPIVDVINELH